MKKFIIFNLVIINLFTGSLLSKDYEYRLNEQFLLNFLNDSLQIFYSPKEWRNKDLLKFGIIAGTTYLLYKNDEEIKSWVLSHKNQTTNEISKYIRNFGDGNYITGLLGGIYLIGEISNEKSLRKTALLGFESFIISGLIVSGIKILAGRMRPYASNKANKFFPFRSESKYHSFPSGHSAAAFAVATVISEQSKNLLIDILAYSTASLVALSRVNDNFHWASDIFVGSAIGYFVGKKIVKIHLQKESASFNVHIAMKNEKFSFIISYSF